MNGADLLASERAELAQMVRDSLLAEAAEAREDAAVFFEFVMRDLRTNEKIRIAPHQRVAIEFILAHDRVALMAPVGSAKTHITVALTLWQLGRDPTTRAAIVSATQAQAEKVVQMIRGYILSSPELRLVFPDLRPSTRKGEAWTQTTLTVDRPPNIKDASLSAYGLDSKQIIGSRLSWITIDDLLNDENTGTPEQREDVQYQLQTKVLSRVDQVGGRAVFVNTPWHPDDALHRAEKAGWATMRMDVYGDIIVQDDVAREDRARLLGIPYEPWDSDLLRPSSPDPSNAACRLVAHEPDEKNEVPLWPERYPIDVIERLRKEYLPVYFNQLYRSQCRDDASSMCKSEYVDLCLKTARELGVFSFTHTYAGPNLTFTGVDLAISPGEEHDKTAFFTFEARPGGLNVILDIQVFQANGPEILDKLYDTQRRYNSVVRVESNAAQMYIKQFALARDLSFPIYAHTTGRAKAHPEHGVPGMFAEMMNGAWAFPNSKRGELHPTMKAFVDASLYYSPSKHTADELMACYFAREQKRAWMGMGGKAAGNSGATAGGIASNALSR